MREVSGARALDPMCIHLNLTSMGSRKNGQIGLRKLTSNRYYRTQKVSFDNNQNNSLSNNALISFETFSCNWAPGMSENVCMRCDDVCARRDGKRGKWEY